MAQTQLRNEQITSEAANDGDVLTANGSGGAQWEAPAAAASAFTDLTDAPATYSGQAGKIVQVKATEDGLEFVANSSTGQYLQFLYALDGLGGFNFLTAASGEPLMGLENLQ